MKYKQFKQLIERDTGSGRLYHWSYHWREILNDKALKTTFMYEGGAEIELLPNKEKTAEKYGKRFVSFARSIGSSQYTRYRHSDDDVTVYFEFNRETLRDRYKIIPVNWYQPKGDTPLATNRSQDRTEVEDRILTSKSTIPIEPHLLGVHILINDQNIQMRYKSAQRGLDEAKREIKKYSEMMANVEKQYHKQRKIVADAGLGPDDFMDKRVEAVLDTQARLSNIRIRLMTTRRSYIHFKNQLDDGGEFKYINEIEEISKNFPSVPFYVYTSPAAFNARRWAEADQINPALQDVDDYDYLEDFEEEDDEV